MNYIVIFLKETAKMKLLYCPKCLKYLEGGDGTMQDCTCGWKQPDYEEDEISRKEQCNKENMNKLEDEI